MPSRREFNPYFHNVSWSRNAYLANDRLPNLRTDSYSNQLAARLFQIQANRKEFDTLLRRILDPVPDWVIEQADQGQYYLKYSSGSHTHSSEGMGEGLVSLLFIVDALYDAGEADTITIDEPELSLHPAIQRRLMKLFRELSDTRQIIYATHSPYFVDPLALANGATLVRVYKESDACEIATLGDRSKAFIARQLRNLNNPHVFGLDAREVFFLDGGIVLVEGQEDVLILPLIAKQLDRAISGAVYGWGIGGADNMEMFASILSELGFKKVLGILDSNRSRAVPDLQKKFPEFSFVALPADDIRDKDRIAERAAVQGVADSGGKLHERNAKAMSELLDVVDSYFKPKKAPLRTGG